MAIINANKNNFEQLTTGNGKVFIDFFAPWCGPCKMLLNILDQVNAEMPDITLIKVNVDEEPELADRFGVVSVPTVVIMENSVILQKTSGVIPKNKIIELMS